MYYKLQVNIQEKYLNFYGTEKHEVNEKGTISTRSGILNIQDTTVHLCSVN
jgi:hypothetical protein